jgi:hypothetical protein
MQPFGAVGDFCKGGWQEKSYFASLLGRHVSEFNFKHQLHCLTFGCKYFSRTKINVTYPSLLRRRIMGLTNTYVGALNRIPEVFNKIRDGQAPPQVTIQLLKDWGFSSSNDRAFLPLLKALGFLSPTGQPTARYHDYRDHSRSKVVMGEALKEAYHDLFLIKAHPTASDSTAITGKFKSFHNASDNVAQLMSKTFFALLNLADISGDPPKKKDSSESAVPADITSGNAAIPKSLSNSTPSFSGFHYNIQIHLPATKDVEVYNSIFKSLKDHFVD